MQESKRGKEHVDTSTHSSEHQMTEGSMRALEDADTETKALLAPNAQHLQKLAARPSFPKNPGSHKDAVRHAKSPNHSHHRFAINTPAEVRDKLVLECEKLDKHLVFLLSQEVEDEQHTKFVRFECCILMQLRRNIVSNMEQSYSDAVLNDSIIEFVHRVDTILGNIQGNNLSNIEYYLEMTYDLICEVRALGGQSDREKEKWKVLRDKFRKLQSTESNVKTQDFMDIHSDVVDIFNAVRSHLDTMNPKKSISLFDKMMMQ